jgi:hypothetical protein
MEEILLTGSSYYSLSKDVAGYTGDNSGEFGNLVIPVENSEGRKILVWRRRTGN